MKASWVLQEIAIGLIAAAVLDASGHPLVVDDPEATLGPATAASADAAGWASLASIGVDAPANRYFGEHGTAAGSDSDSALLDLAEFDPSLQGDAVSPAIMLDSAYKLPRFADGFRGPALIGNGWTGLAAPFAAQTLLGQPSYWRPLTQTFVLLDVTAELPDRTSTAADSEGNVINFTARSSYEPRVLAWVVAALLGLVVYCIGMFARRQPSV